MKPAIRLLHLEDDPRDAELIRLKLKAEGLSCDITWVNAKEAFESALDRETFDVVLSDYNLPDYDGLSALRRVREKQPQLPVIVISGTLGEEEAVDCLKAGAADYVLKQRLQRLGTAVRRALAEKAEREKRLAAEDALRESEERFRQLAEQSSDVFWFFGVNPERPLYVSPAAERMWGHPVQRFFEEPGLWLASIHPDDRGRVQEAYERWVAEKSPVYDVEYRVVGADGSVCWVQDSGTPIRDEAGNIVGAAGIARNITLRKQHEEKIARLSRIHALLSGINSLIVRIRDRQQLFEEACRLAVEQGGFAFAWIGSPVPGASKLTPVAWTGMDDGYLTEVERALNVTDDAGTGGRALREKRVIVANDIEHDPEVMFRKEALARGFRSLAVFPLLAGEKPAGVFVLYASAVAFFDAEEVKLLSELAGDISFALDNIKKTKQLDYLAYYDSVTGLANRTLFHERLEQGLAAAGQEQRKLALIILDIERFKTINDTLGRQAGDTLLKQIADRMAGNAPDIAWLGRIGADHFAVMAPDVQNVDDLGPLIERRMEAFFGPPFRIGETELRIAAKLGIAVFPGDGADADTLFRNAEAALKKAKASGERYLFYTQAMNERVAEKMALENKLRQALEKDEFVLHYQPKVDLETRSIVGVEALIRWQSPELGLVPPMKFIPLMEETGLILPVGSWALKRASLDHRRWVNQGLQAPRVAVNVSSIQLRQRDFVGSVEQAIMEGVAPTGIDLEITESLIMEDIQGNIEKLKAVRGLGMSIAIDDFGTGYSSLGYLAKLPVQTLKIDRSFIITMLNDADAMTLVSTMISLAHSLRLKVVAEGVDAEEQAKMLRLLHCDEMQGYLFSRPVPFDQLTALLTQGAKV